MTTQRIVSYRALCAALGDSRSRVPYEPMTRNRRRSQMGRVLILFGCAIGCLAQTPPPGAPGVPREGGPGMRPALSASVRLEDWALFRSAAASVLGWRVGVVSDAFRQGTFSEAAAKVDALGLANIAGVSTQKF